jgi:UDP-glucose 4-epimerase
MVPAGFEEHDSRQMEAMSRDASGSSVKIVVTGSEGFIGTHLVCSLCGVGYSVIRTDKIGISCSREDTPFLGSDVITGEGLLQAFKGVDGVVHLAARNHVLKETEKDPLSAYRRVNVDGTRNAVRTAVRAGVRWFIHFSSIKAIGEGGDAVFDESSPCRPATHYGISKLESEEVVCSEVGRSGMRAVIVRLPMAYGPRNRGNLPRMIRWADRGLPFPLFQPDNLRSMVYVENVVAGVLALLKGAHEGVSTYILKDSEDCSTRRIYSAICSELKKTPRFLPVPAVMVRFGGLFSEDFRKISGSFRVSSRKIEKKIGFIPPYLLEEGVARTVEWYKRSVQSRLA